MRIVLLDNVVNVGNKGDIVEVADGYARNYLIPQGFANYASESAVERAEALRAQREQERAERQQKLRNMAESLRGYEMTFTRSADENGHLYGSIRSRDVTEALQEEGFPVEEDMIEMSPIEHTGTHTANVKLETDQLDITLHVQGAQ